MIDRRMHERRAVTWLNQPARRVYVAAIFLALIVAASLGFWRVTEISRSTRSLATKTQTLAAQTQKVAAQTQNLAVQTSRLVLQGRQQRLQTSSEVCRQTNELTAKLRALIIDGATATKPFDRQLRQLGFPSYRMRLARAERQAASLALVDCAALNPRRR